MQIMITPVTGNISRVGAENTRMRDEDWNAGPVAEKKPELGTELDDRGQRQRHQDTLVETDRGNDRKHCGVEPGRAKNKEPGPGTRIEDQERGIGPGDQNREPATRN